LAMPIQRLWAEHARTHTQALLDRDMSRTSSGGCEDVYMYNMIYISASGQGHESDKFRGLFKKGVMYLDGGAESGFNKVERDK
jgi:hypothetical protein